jgi:hypothetical protein
LRGRTKQITQESNFGVNHFSATENGDTLVYQAGDKVMSFNVAQEVATEMNIDVKSDFRFDPVVAKKVTNDIDQYAVSPNGKLTAYVLRGDIYVTRNDKEDSRSVRLTQGAARDQDVEWLNDTSLLFASDRYGQTDLFMLSSSDDEQDNLFRSMKHTVSRLTETPEEEHNPIVSPNGERVVYNQGRGVLISANINEEGLLSNSKTLLDGWDTAS